MRSSITGVAGWQKNSFIDFPGTVSTVLFFSGCNLACPYCHNPDIVRAGPGANVPSQELWGFLEKRKGLVDGVVLSGGEPTLHADLAQTVPALRAIGYRVKLDTNGMLPSVVKALSPDYLALDVKTAPRLYQKLLLSPYGDTRQRLEQSVGMVLGMGENAEVRVTAAPGIVDREIIREIGELVNGVKRVFLQPMRKKGNLLDPEIMKRKMISEEEILVFRDIMAEFVGECKIRGMPVDA
jgi:pyruvate formate lyase activating enzyme